ncbi:MAG: DedA family protein [Gemmatimonadaceae bacterium]|nr:DedA family protein [Gemmatimonadaceae bacterium]
MHSVRYAGSDENMNIQLLIERLSAMPLPMLYMVIGAVSAIENVFPPFPSDAVVAFGAFLAARGAASAVSTFLVCWAGNFAGAAFTYYIGRRYGTGAFMHRLEKYGGKGAEDKLRSLYAKYGFAALFISRFLPGVRALVPPFAGAMQLPPVRTFLAIAAASGIWFLFITWLAFRAGENWEVLYGHIVTSGKIVAYVALAIVIIGFAIWYFRRKRPAT